MLAIVKEVCSKNRGWRVNEATKMYETWVDNRVRRALPARETARRNDNRKGAKIAKFHEWTQLS